MISETGSTHFSSQGFVLVPGVLSGEELALLRDEASELVEAARAGLVSDTRIYDDLPHFLGGRNIAGIEDPLALLPNLSRWIEVTELKALIQATTNQQDLGVEFTRLHCNSRVKYRGFWHRDGENEERSIVAVLYLQDERGFRLLPKGLSPANQSDPHSQNQHLFGDLPGQVICSAEAGDLLLFQAELWHRGHSTSPRLHLHVKLSPGHPVGSTERGQSRPSRRMSTPPKNQSFFRKAMNSANRSLHLIRYLLPGANHSSIFQRD